VIRYLGVGVVLGAFALTPSAWGAVGPTRTVTTEAPPAGQIAVIAADVVAKKGGAPGPLTISVLAAAAIRPQLKIVETTTESGRRSRLVVYAGLRTTTTASAAIARHITVTVRGTKKAVSLRNVTRVRESLPAVSGGLQTMLCDGSEIDEAKGFFGLGKKTAAQLAKAARRVLCNEAKDGDQSFLNSLGIGGPTGNLNCRAFLDDPFWGVCNYTGPPFRHLRLRVSAGNTIVECFAGPNPCVVEPGNSVRFDFATVRQDSGEINIRSSTQRYADWGPLQIFHTEGTETSTFSPGATFDPK
jgi:hypothetical protein